MHSNCCQNKQFKGAVWWESAQISILHLTFQPYEKSPIIVHYNYGNVQKPPNIKDKYELY